MVAAVGALLGRQTVEGLLVLANNLRSKSWLVSGPSDHPCCELHFQRVPILLDKQRGPPFGSEARYKGVFGACGRRSREQTQVFVVPKEAAELPLQRDVMLVESVSASEDP